MPFRSLSFRPFRSADDAKSSIFLFFRFSFPLTFRSLFPFVEGFRIFRSDFLAVDCLFDCSGKTFIRCIFYQARVRFSAVPFRFLVPLCHPSSPTSPLAITLSRIKRQSQRPEEKLSAKPIWTWVLCYPLHYIIISIYDATAILAIQDYF